jgi:chemotaxis protein methyltransferase CheR
MSSTARPTATRAGTMAPTPPVATPVPPRAPSSGTDIDDYVLFCEGVRGLAGLDLLQYKRGQMERRLRSFSERLGIPLLSDYLVLLKRDPGELERFLDRVTINVSQLWRNPEQWVALGSKVIPQLASTGHIRIWSAGCSYGAECYTLAAVCLERAAGVKVEIKGTDIDPRMLARARAGVFSQDDVRTAPPASLSRWFEQTDEGWTAKPELRKVIKFESADLLSMKVPEQAYDLVLCRNVVIYFKEDVRDELHRRLASSLRSGGFLIVGSTERVSSIKELGLTPTQPFIYRKA